MDIDMAWPTFRQWVDVKVDLVNLKVVIRKTENRVNEQTQTGDVTVFCLSDAGRWLYWPEGETFPTACELPIAQFRDEDWECPVCGCTDGSIFVNRRRECFRCYWPDKAITLED